MSNSFIDEGVHIKCFLNFKVHEKTSLSLGDFDFLSGFFFCFLSLR
jgi:hypothetical protein